MIRTVTLLILLLLLAPSGAAQDLGTAVAGSRGGCEPVTPLIDPELEWVGTGTTVTNFVLEVAPAPGGRIYGVVPTGGVTPGFYVADIRPESTAIRITPTIAPGFALAMVVGGDGAIYVLYTPVRHDRTNDRIAAFRPDGTLRATYELGGRYAPEGYEGRFGVTAIDLATDQCTLFLIGNDTLIRRFDVCTGTFLADFATVAAPQARAIRILPDGGVIVSAGIDSFRLERYTSGGSFVRSYPLRDLTSALLLVDGGTGVLTGEGYCSGNWLIARSLASGEIESEVTLQVELPGTIAAPAGWTAAIGATHLASDVPATGTVALIVLAMLVGFAAMFRLK